MDMIGSDTTGFHAVAKINLFKKDMDRRSATVSTAFPETRCLREKGILSIELNEVTGGKGTHAFPPAPGPRFLLMVEGRARIPTGPLTGPMEPKACLLIPGTDSLVLAGVEGRFQFLSVAFEEGAPILNLPVGPRIRRTIAGSPERLWQMVQHLAYDLQSPTPWRKETAALGALLTLRLLTHFLAGIAADGEEDLRRSLDEVWCAVTARLDHDWTLTEMASLHGTSSRQFDRHCRRVLSASPGQYLAGLRLDRARMLLATSRMPVNEVSRIVGYGDPFAFSAAFKRRHGVSPKAVRPAAG